MRGSARDSGSASSAAPREAATGARRTVMLLAVVVVAGLVVLCAFFAGLFDGRSAVFPQRAAIENAAPENDAERAASSAELVHAPRPIDVLPEPDGRVALDDDSAASALREEVGADAAATAPVLPAGELHVVVRTNGRPAVGAVAVHTYPRVTSADFDGDALAREPLVDGVARFTELPSGLMIGAVEIGADPPYRFSLVNPNQRGFVVTIELGDATVHGRVRNPDGTDAVGATVVVNSSGIKVVTTTNVDGSYLAGRHFQVGGCTVELRGNGLEAYPQRTVGLVAAQAHDVSFGPGSRLVRWRGRVIASDGQPVRADDGFAAGSLDLVTMAGRGAPMSVEVVDGAIDQWFEPGIYAVSTPVDVHAASAASRSRDPSTRQPPTRVLIDLSHDLEQDVLLPGAVVRGRVDPPTESPTTAASEVWKGGPIDTRPTIQLRGAIGVTFIEATIGADGAFRFVGLAPGTYVLSWHPNQTHEFVVAERDLAVIELDLTTP